MNDLILSDNRNAESTCTSRRQPGRFRLHSGGMIRVLHLRNVSADYQTESCCAALTSDSSTAHVSTLRTTGRGGNYSLAASAILALRRERDQFDLIHAWGTQALTIAALGGRAPIVYSPDDFPHAGDVRWLRSVISSRQVQVICPTVTMRRRLVERGVPIDRCHLIRPGVSFAKIRRRRNDALRAELGIAPDNRIILAAGESTRAAAHEVALFAATLLNVLDRRDRLLVWGRGPRAEAIRRFARRLQQPTLIDAEYTMRRPIAFEDLLPACDEVMVTAAAGVPTLPISMCMAAGLPIIASVTPTVAELLEDRHTAMFVTKPSARLMAERVLDLRNDPSLQWSITDMARTEAFEYFAQTRFLEQFRNVYQQFAETGAVEIPAPQPGAGLRFHGRG